MSDTLVLSRPTPVDRKTSVVEKPIFSSRFKIPGRRFWFGRARLFEDRVELKGWTPSGRFVRQISLHQIARVEWWTGSASCNLEFLFEDRSSLGLKIDGAGRWKFAIDREAIGILNKTPQLPDEPWRTAAA